MKAGLVDSHCHLMLDHFEPDLDRVLERAQAAGVGALVLPGIDLETSRTAVQMAESDDRLYAAVGIHPHSASSWFPEAERAMRGLAASPAVVAIGEIGLDYHRAHSSREEQRRAFRAQLELARELGLPVIVHNRDATEDVLSELEAWTASLPAHLEGHSGVLHAFRPDQTNAERAASLGFYLGIGGPITYRGARAERQAAASLPLDRLLIETDSPYLPPQPHRGQRNEPAFLPLVAATLAEAVGVPVARLSEATTANAIRLFKWNHGTANNHLL